MDRDLLRRLQQSMRATVLDALRPLQQRVNMMVTRMVVSAVNDSGGLQLAKGHGYADEGLEDVEHAQPGGLAHVALPGAEGVRLSVGGRGDLCFVVGLANRSARPTGLAPGETALYLALPAPLGGIKVLCKADGTLHLGSDDGAEALALAGKLKTIIGLVLAGGIGATGTNAFAAAKVVWDAQIANPLTDFESTKVLVEDNEIV